MARVLLQRVAEFPKRGARVRGGVAEIQVGAQFGLGGQMPQFLALDANAGNSDVYLPQPQGSAGLWFRILAAGGGGNDLNIKTDPNTVLVQMNDGNVFFFVCDGNGWDYIP